ncbi:MAG: hypothetical protein GX349_03505 [Firmicutes bacterium]|nr:hypothetical protein [Bacillota bacterium]
MIKIDVLPVMADLLTAPKLDPKEEKVDAVSSAFPLLIAALLGEQPKLYLGEEIQGQAPLPEDGVTFQPVCGESVIPYFNEEQIERINDGGPFETPLANINAEDGEGEAFHWGAPDTTPISQLDNEPAGHLEDMPCEEGGTALGIFPEERESTRDLALEKTHLPRQLASSEGSLEYKATKIESETLKTKISTPKGEGETPHKGAPDYPLGQEDSQSVEIFSPATKADIQVGQETLEAPSIDLARDNLLPELVSHVKMMREKGETQLKIQLKPEHLGRLRLEFLYREGKVSTHLVTKNHQVRELILSHLTELRETLNQQNILPENMDIDVFVDGQGLENETTAQGEGGTRQQAFRSFPPKVKGNHGQTYSDIELEAGGLNYLI